ncbi:hypothetical protein MMC12_005909 [Toensbergia leucococca]|nr:hypothetical protein [Toensbergia leucococca]
MSSNATPTSSECGTHGGDDSDGDIMEVVATVDDGIDPNDDEEPTGKAFERVKTKKVKIESVFDEEEETMGKQACHEIKIKYQQGHV